MYLVILLRTCQRLINNDNNYYFRSLCHYFYYRRYHCHRLCCHSLSRSLTNSNDCYCSNNYNIHIECTRYRHADNIRDEWINHGVGRKSVKTKIDLRNSIKRS